MGNVCVPIARVEERVILEEEEEVCENPVSTDFPPHYSILYLLITILNKQTNNNKKFLSVNIPFVGLRL